MATFNHDKSAEAEAVFSQARSRESTQEVAEMLHTIDTEGGVLSATPDEGEKMETLRNRFRYVADRENLKVRTQLDGDSLLVKIADE